MSFFQNFLLLAQIILTTSTDLRIVGGRLANPGEFPYQVSLRRSHNNLHFCGGTIISPRHVLTAAHCCYYGWGGVMPPYMLKVVAGQVPLQTTESTVSRNASRIIIHPNYDKDSIVNDVAIIELEEELPIKNNIQNIALNNKLLTGNTSCLVSGWGVLNYTSNRVSQDLLVTTVFSLTRQQCQNRYDVIGFTLSDGMLCAVNDFTPADSCQGDSGGPLVCGGVLAGVVSTGKGCANNSFPGIYTDVGYFRRWIDETVGLKKFSDGTMVVFTENLTESSTEVAEIDSIFGWFTSAAFKNVQKLFINLVFLVIADHLFG